MDGSQDQMGLPSHSCLALALKNPSGQTVLMTCVWAALDVDESLHSATKGISQPKGRALRPAAAPASLLPVADLGNRDGEPGVGAAVPRGPSGQWPQEWCTIQWAPRSAL